MRGLRVSSENAQQVKSYLIAHELLHTSYRPLQDDGWVIFPINRDFSAPFDFDVEFVEASLDEREQTQPLRDALASVLSPDEMELLVTSFDIVGTIAITEIPDRLVLKEGIIADKIMAANPSVKTVLKKASTHEGTFRTRRMVCIGGEDVRESIVVENGVRLRVDVEAAYYSIRMATERRRIVDLVQPGEHVLCLFSGVGPYPIEISKHTQAANITGVEINPKAHELAQENVAMNRCTNVHLLLGDALEILPKLAAVGEKFDRVTMPLPHTAHEYLDLVLDVCSPGAVIHYYSFQKEGDLDEAVEQVKAAFRRKNLELGKYSVVKAGQHAPRVWRVVVDAQVAHQRSY